MPKFVVLTLIKVKYPGKAIGNDIIIEIKYKGSVLEIKKKMKRGTEIQSSDQILEEWVSESPFRPKLKMKTTEDDGIFDDEGFKDEEIEVDINKETTQVSIHDIEVRERRGLSPGQSKAVFSLTIQALVHSFIYILPLKVQVVGRVS